MKKLLIFLITAALTLSAAGCKKTDDESSVKKDPSSVSSHEKNEDNSESSKTENLSTEPAATETDSNSAEESSENTEESAVIEPDSSAQDNDSDSNSSSQSDESPNESNITAAAQTLYQSGIEMFIKVMLSSPYPLDYDSMDSMGNILIADSSVTSVDDIANYYCNVFSQPDSYIYERYTETDGRVYCNDASRGTNIYYKSTDLEYVSDDGSTFTFNAVSHYGDPDTGENPYDKTATFSFELTDNGYRITEFTFPE